MTDHKDDGGPFHPEQPLGQNGLPSAASWPGASFRAVSAMLNHAALLSRSDKLSTACRKCGYEERGDAAEIAAREADALIAELKK